MPKIGLAHNAEHSPATAKDLTAGPISIHFIPAHAVPKASSQCCSIAPCVAVSCQCHIPISMPEADDYGGDVIAAVSGFHDLPIVVCLRDQLHGTSLLSGDLKLAEIIALTLLLDS